VALLYVIPALILLAIFRVLPVFEGVYLSFTDWDGYTSPTWAGWANYRHLVRDPILGTAVRNTGLVLLSFPVWVALPLVLAIILFERPVIGRYLKIAYLIPTLISPAMLGLCFTLILGYQGPVNSLLRAIGLESLSHQWLVDPATVLWAFVAILIWGAFGTGVLFYVSALASVDVVMWEAAELDGAGWLTRLWYVTLPLLRPVVEFWSVVVVVIMLTSTFGLLFTLTRGGPGHASTTLDFYLYQVAFVDNEPSYAAALGVAMFILVAAVIMLQLRVMRRGREENEQ
jgi:ABC-type sugar transport system permease subunit